MSDLSGASVRGAAENAAGGNPGALAESARDAIRDAVLEGRFGPGESVRPESVSAWLGLPAVPVLDAIDVLIAEQLLENDAQGETRVIDPSPDAIDEILHTVGVLMGGVVRLSIPALITQQVSALRELLAEVRASILQESARAHIEAALRVYGALLDSCPTPTLVSLTRGTFAPLGYRYLVGATARQVDWHRIRRSWIDFESGLLARDPVRCELAIEALHRLPSR